MERLTARAGKDITYMGRHTKLPGIDGASSMRVAATRDVLQRLADYEDSGMDPEEVERLKLEHELLKLAHAQAISELHAATEKVETANATLDKLQEKVNKLFLAIN